MLHINELIGFGVGKASEPRGVVFNGTMTMPSAAVTTFSNVGIGAEDDTRIVVIGTRSIGTTTGATAVTIAGVSATRAGGGSQLWYAAVPTGLQADVVVTWGFATAGDVISMSVYGTASTPVSSVSVAVGDIGPGFLSTAVTGSAIGDLAIAHFTCTDTKSGLGGTAGYSGDLASNAATSRYYRTGTFTVTTAGGTVSTSTAVAGYRDLGVLAFR